MVVSFSFISLSEGLNVWSSMISGTSWHPSFTVVASARVECKFLRVDHRWNDHFKTGGL